MSVPTQAYFGDGVYAECRGFEIILTANGTGSAATDVIYLEPSMIQAIYKWAKNGYPDYSSGKTFGEHGSES